MLGYLEIHRENLCVCWVTWKYIEISRQPGIYTGSLYVCAGNPADTQVLSMYFQVTQQTHRFSLFISR
jgi:hypothetical protein